MQVKTAARTVTIFVSLFAVLAALDTASAQRKIDILAKVKVGQWVEVEGVPRSDMGINANKVEVLAGDLGDDDWEISGMISEVNREKKTLRMLTLSIEMTPETDIDDERGKVKTFEDLKNEMRVEIEGVYKKDGVLLADDIEPDYIKEGDDPQEMEVKGKIEAIDKQGQFITVMGMKLYINARTKAKGAYFYN